MGNFIRVLTLIVMPCLTFGQALQSWALTESKDLTEVNVKVEQAEYKGRKCIRLTQTDDDGFALIKGTDFQDGTIEADVVVHPTTPPGVRMPGFIGIAFRARANASSYDLFYVRPGNSEASDQAMRNHAVQYCAPPNFGWYRLRREWPWVYESAAEIQPETWTKLKIEVAGRSAKLFLNGLERPSLVVEGLKGEELHGGVALWGNPGEEAYFSNLRIKNTTSVPLQNNGEPMGTWDAKLITDSGTFPGLMKLTRDGNKVSGSWSGALGDHPITGLWRNGYVELTFNGDWTKEMFQGKPGSVPVNIAGWIDGDESSGRVSIEARADGRWTATRKK
jgi:hypothetical protein